MDLEPGPGEGRTISLKLEGDLLKGFMDQKLHLGGSLLSDGTRTGNRMGCARTPLGVCEDCSNIVS